MASTITMQGGVRRARQELSRLGFKVESCRVKNNRRGVRFDYSDGRDGFPLKKTGGRLSVCKVQLTKTADHRRLTDLFMKNKIVWFQR